jgi:hypothetical protein
LHWLFIADRIAVKTYNNDLSDEIESAGTLIVPGTKLFAAASALQIGQP